MLVAEGIYHEGTVNRHVRPFPSYLDIETGSKQALTGRVLHILVSKTSRILFCGFQWDPLQ